MTPAEHARQIDKQEFEAECAAIRRRAYARLGVNASEADQRVKAWLAKPYERGSFNLPARIAAKAPAEPRERVKPKRLKHGSKHTVAGTSLTLRQWADHLGITYNNLNQRIHKLGSLQAVVIRYMAENDR